MAPATHALQITFDEADHRLRMAGRLDIHQLAQARQQLQQLQKKQVQLASADLRELTALDTAGALFLLRWLRDIPMEFGDAAHETLLQHLASLELPQPKPEPSPRRDLRAALVSIGRWVDARRVDARDILTFTGKALVLLSRSATQPGGIRYGAVCQHIYAIGVSALPIIGLMAFLISIVLAYQGIAQLRPYGGEQFTVNLVALSILREMGVLLTAIMVAGRSGSAFTAEIGVMKAREEVDALQVMGLEPFAMLVTPRILAIVIALPLLTFYADLMGMFGGYIIIHSLIGISLEQYLDRIHAAVSLSDLFAGMIKAPVFAFFIGVVGCMHGLRVSGSAESIGYETTAAVVKSIFLVLVLDAFFSIFFEQVGL
ncbi:MAG: ABC transporter permease [Azospirillum brasilense]|nr:MAG: ABC transporter permease [Azospirillum brasilense]